MKQALETAKAALASEDQAVIDAAEDALWKALAELVEFRFDDVADETQYYFEPVYWAFSRNPQITKGTTDKEFSPDAGCTRAQAVTFLWRAMGCEKPAKPAAFDDVPEDAYYAEAVAWAVEKGITAGVSKDKFAPNNTCTRGQIVTFLHRYAGEPEPKSTETPFTDLKEGGFYVKAVAWAVENDVTAGVSKDKFAPNNTCTRAQVVTFLYRVAK